MFLGRERGMQKIAVLMDGGNTRALARQAGHRYDPDYIQRIALACVAADEELLRILYYDCAPYNGTQTLPISGDAKTFTGSDEWLERLARKDLFAVRLGILKFRGFKPKRIPIAAHDPSDDDFKPDFEQKGVDMRIGLDIATFCSSGAVQRIALITGDTDCIPAMKHARKAGLQVVLIRFANSLLAPELLEHTDYLREVAWPASWAISLRLEDLKQQDSGHDRPRPFPPRR